MGEELMTADADMDNLIDEKELEKALANNPKAFELLQTTGAKDLLAKYDISGDGVLDKAEMTAILRELAEKESVVMKEMQETEEEQRDVEAKLGEAGKMASGTGFAAMIPGTGANID